jgi:hypothetical protein
MKPDQIRYYTTRGRASQHSSTRPDSTSQHTQDGKYPYTHDGRKVPISEQRIGNQDEGRERERERERKRKKEKEREECKRLKN